MDTALLTWYQALQLAALGPCFFVIFFLCVTTRHLKKVAVPTLYFASLSCNFLIPLIEPVGISDSLRNILETGATTTAAFSFLIIIQFITGDIPALIYWTALAIPLIGGSPIDYVASITKSEVYIYEKLCAEPSIFRQLYEIFSSSLIFLLTIVLYHRLNKRTESNYMQDKNKYAIIISLIVLNLMVLGVKLLYISGHVVPERAGLAATVVRMGFIYLVLTFVFRVFDRQLDIAYERVPTLRPAEPTQRDTALAENIRKLLAEEKLYRTMELNRAAFAKKLAVPENYLSKVINMCFSQSFSTLINTYRIEEARQRLTDENIPITTIAFEVGFNSIPSFNRVFKQMTGVSPSEYRTGHSLDTSTPAD